MRIIKFAVFSLVVLTSCQSFGPPLPRKYAREFLQSKNYPALLIEKIMKCEKLSEVEFYQLGNSEDKNVRYMIVSNPYTPIPLLTKLAKDPDVMVRQGVAHNTSITKDIIDTLNQGYIVPNVDTRKYDWRVRSELVQNPSVPDDVILEIYEKRQAPLEKIPLAYFALNPNCPEIIKQDIRNSWNSSAKQNLKIIDDKKKAGVYVQWKNGRWYKP